MNQHKHLILLKGEDKTRDIQFCQYNSQTQKYDVTFNDGKVYHYAYHNIEWLRDPLSINPLLHRISRDGKIFNNIQSIWVFCGSQEWFHIVYDNGYEKTYPKCELNVEKSCLDNEQIKDRLAYLRDVAGINELRNDDGEVLLKKQYEKLSFVGEESVLANYLYPQQYPIKSLNLQTLIFPFGGNASQFKAVQNALTSQMSVIQGPPGTGKTQTILNIVANLLVRGKNMQIVSNNNSATQNVFDKLASPKYNMDFLVAVLGKRENKESFIEGQTDTYPDISAWQKNEEDIRNLQERVVKLSAEVTEYFEKQKRLAISKQELNDLELESKYFNDYYNENKPTLPTKKPRKNLKTTALLRVLQECEVVSEQDLPLSVWLKIRCTVIYGIFEWRYWSNNLNIILSYLQSLFYTLKHEELLNEIKDLENFLLKNDAKGKMDMLTKCSMDYLKAFLFKKYGNKQSRPHFTLDDIWKNPEKILDEYPIVLSTTFSSRSCLKDATYDYLIMDEASQVDLATGALALASSKNAVIVGDLKQLPNVIPEEIYKQSEALFKDYQLPNGYNFAQNSFLKSICAVIPDVPQTLLREHYRCHPKIIDFCNKKFYQNQLVIMTDDHDEADTLCIFRTVAGDHKRGHVNQRQIDVTKEEVLPRIINANPEDIGVIAPYRDQVSAFSSLMHDSGVEVDTVHKFQGREKDVIIITTVDDQVTEFSDDPYLLNVAISRAKKKLYLVISNSEQPEDSNIKDLIAYIQYNNFDVVESEIYSVFDMLYQQYTQERINFLAKHRKISQYDSENLMYATIVEMLDQIPEMGLNVISHQKVRMLLRGTGKLTDEEFRYAMHPNTHVDFLIYNRITKIPVLAVEVDGFNFHKDGSQQAERDRLKDSIFKKYGIPLLRLPTNGSGEIAKIKDKLLS